MEQPEKKNYKLTTKNLFNHFLLVHDFLYKFTKTHARDQHFLDAQLDVQQMMNIATARGGRMGQFLSLVGISVYCLKSNSIPMKFFAGFLYFYWINHFYTLGSYCGALMKMPKAYRRVGYYYENYNQTHPNLLDQFEDIMQKEQQYQDTHAVLGKIFPQISQVTGETYTTNDYFIKYRDKYFSKEEDSLNAKKLKLAYFDNFLTRYVYYSFARWFHRLQLFLGVAQE